MLTVGAPFGEAKLHRVLGLGFVLHNESIQQRKAQHNHVMWEVVF